MSNQPLDADDIERLIVSDARFQHLDRALGRFCVFEALNVVRGEVPLGNLLAAFLDPRRPHRFGANILRTFLMETIRAGRSAGLNTEGLTPLSAYLLNLDEAEVRREWRCIDILIRIEHAKLVVAIELKFDSQQGVNQLVNYRQVVEQEFTKSVWQHLYVFLTVRPEEPFDKVWIPLRFADLIPALEEVRPSEADVAATSALSSFLSMLRRHHVTDEALEEIARKLWSTHREALTFLADRRPDGMRGVFSGLRDQVKQIATQINHKELTFTADHSSTTSLRFACLQWDELPGMKQAVKWTPTNRILLFELKRYGEQAAAELYLGPGEQAARDVFMNILAPFRHRQDLSPGNDWMCVAKQIIFSPQTGEDLDVGAARDQIISGFTKFCREVAAKLDSVLRPPAADVAVVMSPVK